MARPIWSGAISFGLVNVPVKLMTAVRQKEVHFHMLHDEDGARIELRRVCTKDGEEVAYEHIVKGYEISRGEHVIVTKKELEALDPKGSRSIDIEDFVSLDEIDPIHYEHTYYLVPDKGAAKAYTLLLEAMKRTGKVAIGRMVMRTKKYLCTLRPLGRVLVLSTMQYADEIVPADDLDGMPSGGVRVAPRELELAEQLVASLSTEFDPKKYHDDYREELLALIERKAAGEEIVRQAAPAQPARTVDLFEALEASLGKGRRERDVARPVREPRPRRARPAARAAKSAGPRRTGTGRGRRARAAAE
jgi:DNA end-binding protein Ku